MLAGQLNPHWLMPVQPQPVQPSGAVGQAQLLLQVICWHELKQPAEVLLPGAQAPSPPQAP